MASQLLRSEAEFVRKAMTHGELGLSGKHLLFAAVACVEYLSCRVVAHVAVRPGPARQGYACCCVICG